MSEEDLAPNQEHLNAGLLHDDIVSRVYEGGFKTWECSIDLAKYLATLINTGKLFLHEKDVHIIEVRFPPLRINRLSILKNSSRLTDPPKLAWRRYGTAHSQSSFPCPQPTVTGRLRLQNRHNHSRLQSRSSQLSYCPKFPSDIRVS